MSDASGFHSGIIDPDSMPASPEKPKKEKVYYFLVAGAATVVLVAGIKAASGIIAPMLLALFLTIILLVPLRWLQKKGCPRILSLLIVLGGTVLVFSSIGFLVARSLNDFIKSLPSYRTQIVRKIDALDQKWDKLVTSLNMFNPERPNGEENALTPLREPNGSASSSAANRGNRPDEINGETKQVPPVSSRGGEGSPASPPPPDDQEAGKEGEEASLPVEKPSEEMAQEAPEAETEEPEDNQEFRELLEAEAVRKPALISLDAKSMMQWVSWFFVELRHLAEGGFLVLIFTVFMIFETARFPEKVDRAFGKEGPINNRHFHQIASDIRRYLFLKAISSLMSAAAATAVYWIFGVPATLFWGVVAFFLYFIPNVGGTLAAIIPGMLIFMTYDIEGVLLYAVCLVAIECAIAYGIEPKMLGHGLGISTVVIILSLFTWGWILGPIGLFLAAPLTIMVKIILQAFKETEWIAILLSDKIRT